MKGGNVVVRKLLQCVLRRRQVRSGIFVALCEERSGIKRKSGVPGAACDGLQLLPYEGTHEELLCNLEEECLGKKEGMQ